jgi:hypothetical protein
MSDSALKFSCGGCGRIATWRRELAGKRVRCKCGHVTTVPAEPPEQDIPEEVDLYALADDANRAAVNLPPTIVDPSAFAPAPVAAAPAAAGGIPLAYQTGLTARQKELSSAKTFIDPNRDLKVPALLLVAGIALYIGYYAIHYNLGAMAIVSTGLGLTVMTILETALLVCFALAIAGPLGVSFGGIGTALLKFAAVVVLSDGIGTWVDGILGRYTAGIGGGGVLGFGVIGFPIALAVYWCCLNYLFSMDAGDSWMVVVILAIFYRIIRVVVVMLLLKLILSFGGVGAAAIAIPSVTGQVAVNPVIDAVNAAKAQNVLHEAKKYAADNGRRAEAGYINDWYGAGAKNVWYQTSRDINGKGDAFQFVIELPDSPAARAKCYAISKKYFNDNKMYYSPSSVQDNGDPYLIVGLP